MQTLSLAQVEHIAFKLAQERLKFDEPIPAFSTRYPDRLESCIYTPFQTAYGKSLYPKLTLKASVLFYLMLKNHPFKNGNKSIALTTLLVFLHNNGKWLIVDPQELYNFCVWVAQSPALVKDHVIAAIELFITRNLTTDSN